MFLPPGLTPEQAEYFALLDSDAKFFIRQLWLEIGSERPDGTGRAPLSELEYDFVQNSVAPSPTTRVLLGCRGLGKTYLVAATNAVWRLFRDPRRKVVIVCKNEATAIKTSTLIRGWLDSVWFLRHMRPTKAHRDNAKSFDVGMAPLDRQPSISVVGIGGTLENNRAHTVIVDDIETIGNTVTFDARERLANQTGEFMHWLYPSVAFEEGGARDPNEILYTLTPNHEETIVHKLNAAGHPIFAYPLCVPKPDEQTFPLAPGVIAFIEQGKARSDGCLFPKRFTELDVEARRRQRLEWLKGCQLVRHLADSDRYPLKLRDFMVFDIAGDEAPVSLTWGTRDHNGSTALEDLESGGIGQDRFYRPIHVTATSFAPFTGTKMYVDPAGTGTDLTGYAIVSHLNGFYWVRRMGGLKGGATPENLAALARLAYETTTQEIVVEQNFGGDAYRAALEIHVSRLHVKPNARPDKPKGFAANVISRPTTATRGHKELRIIKTIEPMLSNHRLIIPTDVAANPLFQKQVSRLSHDRGCLDHDDLVDALAGCLDAWGFTFADGPKDLNDAADPRIAAHIERLRRKYGKAVSWFTAH